MRLLPLLAVVTLAAACTQPRDTGASANAAADGITENIVVPDESGTDAAADANAAAAAPPRAADLTGRWLGVEGMYLTVTPRTGNRVDLDMQWDLDHKGLFDGTVTEDGIRFTRDGKPLLLRHTDGDATGLKYLAGKRDCLTVASGEGYCRG